MIGLFRAGYRLAYDTIIYQDYFLSLVLSAVSHFSLQMMIMIPACLANEEAKHVAQILPDLIPRHESDLKLQFEKEFRHQKYLSLWNIYFFDRSLIIASNGALLTYGILFGTIGKGC
ncbi:hypothetical protein AVEN_229536-1 [Araneus ventricosus]|uniref:Uncharacterized protein n=1 Tax=Araneus ventricosus TaxID=182803 RepID=A0A4Y2EGT8_ARAVE|nr:hypothetical protein AVEN_229536-1 [Araneus ventricosus]